MLPMVTLLAATENAGVDNAVLLGAALNTPAFSASPFAIGLTV